MYYYVQGAAECGFQLQQRTAERIIVFIEVQKWYHVSQPIDCKNLNQSLTNWSQET